MSLKVAYSLSLEIHRFASDFAGLRFYWMFINRTDTESNHVYGYISSAGIFTDIQPCICHQNVHMSPSFFASNREIQRKIVNIFSKYI